MTTLKIHMSDINSMSVLKHCTLHSPSLPFSKMAREHLQRLPVVKIWTCTSSLNVMTINIRGGSSGQSFCLPQTSEFLHCSGHISGEICRHYVFVWIPSSHGMLECVIYCAAAIFMATCYSVYCQVCECFLACNSDCSSISQTWHIISVKCSWIWFGGTELCESHSELQRKLWV